MLAHSDLVAFVATSDLERARSFYGDTLGLPLVDQSPFACVFDAHGTSLRVTLAAEVRPAPYTVLGWAVTDASAGVGGLIERGLEPLRYPGLAQDAQGIWDAPGGAGWCGSPIPTATCCR